MAEEWFTYAALGERLNVSPEAARQKAIRARWPRWTANDGKAQVRVNVDDVLATAQVRKPQEPNDTRPTADETPVDPPSDTQAIAAFEAHIATLREMVAKAEGIAERERGRADDERARADAERGRADGLFERLEQARTAAGTERTALDRDIAELRAVVEGLRRPWWRRLAG